MRVITLHASKLRQAALEEQLRGRGIEVDIATSINGLLSALRRRLPEAVLLEDVGATLADWLAVLKLKAGDELPLIVLGAPGGMGIAESLAQGASDYIDYAMPIERVVERLRAHAAKRGGDATLVTRVGPFTLSEATMTVHCKNVEITLTPREFSVARVLFASVGCVVPLGSLSARVWGASANISKRTLEQHVYKLRRKLEKHFKSALRIQAAYGIGYRLDLIAHSPLVRTFGDEPANRGAAASAGDSGAYGGKPAGSVGTEPLLEPARQAF